MQLPNALENLSITPGKPHQIFTPTASLRLRLGPVLAEEWLKEFESHNDRLGFVLVPAHVHMRTHAQCGAIMLIITRRSFQTQANPFKP